MRFLPLVLLMGCYDAASTTLVVDLKSGMATVRQQLHNAWPDTVGCDEVPVTDAAGCVTAVKAHLDAARAELATKGGQDVTSGIVVADGKLDLVYSFTAPVGAEALNDQSTTVLSFEDRSSGQVAKGKPGKRHVGLLVVPGATGATTQVVEGRYRLLSSSAQGEGIDLYLLKGRTATIQSGWVNTPDADDPQSPGAWLTTRPGLEDALRASGLVVTGG
jgi:hypothetical protein